MARLIVEKLAHDTIRINTVDPTQLTIIIDPFKAEDDIGRADLLLISHPHYDHCSLEDLKKTIGPATEIITVPDCSSKLADAKCKAVHLMTPGKEVTVKGVTVKAVPAYNTDKQFHPKENEWIGFLITISGTTVYFAGDTDLIPEMQELGKVDIACLPVSGTYVMTAEEAVQAALRIKPRKVLPMHWGSIVGTEKDAEHFAELLKEQAPDIEVL